MSAPAAAVVTEHVVSTPRHSTFFLACGRDDAPPIVFVHGWPELSISWRHQLPFFAAHGFRAIAPDMRGYGRSTVHPKVADYAMAEVVADLDELRAALGCERCLWVGHDWGAAALWHYAQQHPDRVAALANLCVPYLPGGFSIDELVPYVDRRIYPADAYPVGQWDYHLHHEQNADAARAEFEADPRATVKALFRSGRPEHRGRPSRLASVRRDGGWFPNGRAPDLPRDERVLGEADLDAYAGALAANGFFGPDAWYRNARANTELARTAKAGGRLAMPVLFFHALYDPVCETIDSRLAEPTRAHCADLTEVTLPTGHWMAQEAPDRVNAELLAWLRR